MEEIFEEVDETSLRVKRIDENRVARGAKRRTEKDRMADTVDCEMVEINLKVIGPSAPIHLRVPSQIQVQQLRKLVAENVVQPIDNLKLILRGNVLEDRKFENMVHLRLCHGDSLMVAVKPKPPARHLRDDFDAEDDDLFQLPQGSSRWRRRLHFVLREKLKVPEIVVMALLSLTPKPLAITILWFLLAPVAHRWNLGPLYILATGFAIIFMNLGHRKDGELSAYSVFNEDFRELPGTLNAERLDSDIRAGQF